MATRGKSFGLSGEIKKKMDSKYDEEAEQEVMEWIVHHLPERKAEKPSGLENVHAWLKDGIVLCELINKLQPGSVKKINKMKMAFMQMENTSNFLKAIGNFGVQSSDLFQTVDLYEAQNMAQVITTLSACGRLCYKKGLAGIGPKESDKNERNFSAEQLQAGKNIIGLQMGTNKGASQAGQNFGKSRQIMD